MSSIKNKWANFLILVLCVFLLATLLAGALSTGQAMINTSEILRAQLPPVAKVTIDGEALEAHIEEMGQWSDVAPLTPALVHELGSLSYVRDYDYFTRLFGLHSGDLVRAFDPELFRDTGLDYEDWIDLGSLAHFDRWDEDIDYEHFSLKGVHNPNILDISTGLIDLVEGRTFTQEEVQELHYVAVVSRDFLEANDLLLGSSFVLENRIYPDDAIVHNFLEPYLASSPIVLEIVGVFEKEFDTDTPDHILGIHGYFDFINHIYVPNLVVTSVFDFYWEVLPEIDPDLYAERQYRGDREEITHLDNVLFWLYDAAYLGAFEEAAHDILPDFYVIEDMSMVFGVINNSMDALNDIVNGLIVGTVAAMLVVLSLLLMLLLRARRHEVGIYVALGEKKGTIFAQFFLEIMIASLIGITLGLFVGNMIAAELSHSMIAQDIAQQFQNPDRTITYSLLHGMGYHAPIMTAEEMLDAYTVRLDLVTVAYFYGVALTIILVTVLLSLWGIFSLKPKEILMD